MKRFTAMTALLCAICVAGLSHAQEKPAPVAPAAAPVAAAPTDAKAPEPAAAPTTPQRVKADKISAGDTAWMLTSTALVLLMTIPVSPCSTAAW